MKTKTIVCVLIVLSLLAVTFLPTIAATDSTVDVTFINVGQGDSILLQDPNGYTVLIDGGVTSAGQIVLDYLRSRGVTTINNMVVSHPDADHIGGLITVLNATDIAVQHVLYNGYPGSSATWSNFVTAVGAEGLSLETITYPQELTWGVMTVQVLNPASGLASPETNEASLVLKVIYGSTEYLLTGDIDATIEATVMARGTSIAADVLKVAHHGSAYSSSANFLASVQPADSVISVGANSYGHPSADTISRLLAVGSNVWRTDEDGNVLVDSDGITYQVIPQFGTETVTETITETVTVTVTLTPNGAYYVYIPLVFRATTPSPTPTTTTPPPPTATTPPPIHTTGNIQITSIFYDGAGTSEPDEYVVIQNKESFSIQVQNWTLRDAANHVFYFPSYTMQAGQTCRVYTNQSHPEYCGFNYGSGSAIWNNTGDNATLKDSTGKTISTYTY